MLLIIYALTDQIACIKCNCSPNDTLFCEECNGYSLCFVQNVKSSRKETVLTVLPYETQVDCESRDTCFAMRRLGFE